MTVDAAAGAGLAACSGGFGVFGYVFAFDGVVGLCSEPPAMSGSCLARRVEVDEAGAPEVRDAGIGNRVYLFAASNADGSIQIRSVMPCDEYVCRDVVRRGRAT